MNAGFSSLTKLKKAILPAPLRTRVDWDDALVDLGKGVVEMIEGHCNRRFAWVVEDTYTTDANRIVVSVPVYPVSVWDAVEMQSDPTSAFSDISGSVTRYESRSGILYFRSAPGDELGSIKVTLTGGYWWDTNEDASGEIPAGATSLPFALFTAWTMQVQAIAQAQDLFGAASGKPQSKANENTLLPQAELLQAVQSMITPYRRFAA